MRYKLQKSEAVFETGKSLTEKELKEPVQFYKKTWLVLWWLNLVSTYQMALESLEESSVLILLNRLSSVLTSADKTG